MKKIISLIFCVLFICYSCADWKNINVEIEDNNGKKLKMENAIIFIQEQPDWLIDTIIINETINGVSTTHMMDK